MKNHTEEYEFLLAVIANVPYGVIAVDKGGNITMINETALQNLNINETAKNCLEANILDLVTDIPELPKVLADCFKNDRKVFELKEILFKEKYLNIHGKPTSNGMLISNNDVTETKKAQIEATLSLLKGQEMERRRLSQEIHDGIGPLLSTIRLNLDAVTNDLIDAPEKTLQKVQIMNELIQNVATDIRDISHALMPSTLMDFGLVEGVNSLCQKANKSELINIDFLQTGLTERLNQNLEWNLYRIIQELLNNALKYASAKQIDIQLIKRKNKIVLTVEDNGVGFDETKIDDLIQNGIGFRNINTRVSS